MARPLVAVAITGIAVSVICLSLASMLNLGRGMPFVFGDQRHSRAYPWGLYPWTSYVPFIESGDIVTREFDWNGDTTVDIAIPGVVYYEPGPEWRVTVKGPETSVQHLRVDDGRIFFDAPSMSPHTSSVEVRITGPSLETFSVNGRGKLILEHIAQKSLTIEMRGSGSVQGSGTVEKLGLGIFGSGNVRLGELATGDTDVGIFGSGEADVAPTGDAMIAIFGSGNVRLHTKPGHLSQRIMGSGRVIQMDAGPNAI